jgi:hypothetical protein
MQIQLLVIQTYAKNKIEAKQSTTKDNEAFGIEKKCLLGDIFRRRHCLGENITAVAHEYFARTMTEEHHGIHTVHAAVVVV